MDVDKLINDLLSVLIAIASIAASAQLAIQLPESISIVPITAQTLAILVVAHILKVRLGLISVFCYLSLGALGGPVFSDFHGGMKVFQSPSSGYLLGFLAATLVVGLMARKQKEKFSFYLVEMTVGTIIILLSGAIGLLFIIPAEDILPKGIKPFLPGGLIKIFLGAVLLYVHNRFKHFMNFERPIEENE
jgi:biotin transport system substrate-specific component